MKRLMYVAGAVLVCLAVSFPLGTLFALPAWGAPVYGVSWSGSDAPSAMDVDQTYVVSLDIANTGDFTWPSSGDNPVQIGYHWYTSAGNLLVWDGERSALPSDVAPGGSTTVTASVIAPSSPGAYVLGWDLIHEGVTWFSLAGCGILYASVDVAGQYGVTWTDHCHYTPSSMDADQTYVVTIHVTNAGNFTWPGSGDNPVEMGYHWYTSAGELVVWDGERSALPADVPSGDNATVQATVTAPHRGGKYILKWDLVQEGVTWFEPQAQSDGWGYDGTNERAVEVIGDSGGSGWLWILWLMLGVFLGGLGLAILVLLSRRFNKAKNKLEDKSREVKAGGVGKTAAISPVAAAEAKGPGQESGLQGPKVEGVAGSPSAALGPTTGAREKNEGREISEKKPGTAEKSAGLDSVTALKAKMARLANSEQEKKP